MLSHIGRFLLVVSFSFSAFSLYQHNETITKFNTNLPAVLKHSNLIPAHIINLAVDQSLYIRLAIVGLLALSTVLLFKPASKFLALLVFLGNSVG